MVVAVALLTLALGASQAPSDSVPVTVFLGPIPSPEGFVSGATQRFADSYKDLREEYLNEAEFRRAITLVDDPSKAQLILEVTDRGRVGIGAHAGTVVATGPNTATGTLVPIRAKYLGARLVVRGSSYRLDIDGMAGVHLRTYRNQAKNVLRQVVEWTDANRTLLRTQSPQGADLEPGPPALP